MGLKISKIELIRLKRESLSGKSTKAMLMIKKMCQFHLKALDFKRTRR